MIKIYTEWYGVGKPPCPQIIVFFHTYVHVDLQCRNVSILKTTEEYQVNHYSMFNFCTSSITDKCLLIFVTVGITVTRALRL